MGGGLNPKWVADLTEIYSMLLSQLEEPEILSVERAEGWGAQND